MDGATLGMIGAIAGTVIGIAGAIFGCASAYRRAANDAQRRFFRKVFLVIAPAIIAFTVIVWLSSTGVLPRWTYYATMIVFFGALGPSIALLNKRLAALTVNEQR